MQSLFGFNLQTYRLIKQGSVTGLFLRQTPLTKPFISNEKFRAVIYLHLKVNIRNTRKRCETCSKLTIKTPFSNVSIVDFEQVNVRWVAKYLKM